STERCSRASTISVYTASAPTAAARLVELATDHRDAAPVGCIRVVFLRGVISTAATGATAPVASSRETLLDFFDDVFRSSTDFLIHDTGYRSWTYYLAARFFNAFPLRQREAGARETLRYIGELVSHGFSILIFPEGERTERGEIKQFRPGVGMMASRLDVRVVPVRLEGLDRVLHKDWHMARPGRVSVTF